MSQDPADPMSSLAEGSPPAPQDPSWITWGVRVVAVAGVLVVAWGGLTGWGTVVHGHPLYAVLLLATLIGSAFISWRTLRPWPTRTGWRRATRIVLVVASVRWVGLMAWLRPFTAVEPALAAMSSDAKVTLADYPTQMIMSAIKAGSKRRGPLTSRPPRAQNARDRPRQQRLVPALSTGTRPRAAGYQA